MDKESRPPLSQKQKQNITDLFNEIFEQSLNRISHKIRNDLISNRIEVSNTQTELKTKMVYFCEQLFNEKMETRVKGKRKKDIHQQLKFRCSIQYIKNSFLFWEKSLKFLLT